MFNKIIIGNRSQAGGVFWLRIVLTPQSDKVPRMAKQTHGCQTRGTECRLTFTPWGVARAFLDRCNELRLRWRGNRMQIGVVGDMFQSR